MAFWNRSKINELGREYFSPIHLRAGDSIVTTFNYCGKEVCKISKTVDREMIVDCGVLFETVYEGKRAYGGMFLEQAK